MAYRREYEESDAVRQARELAQQQSAQKPAAYQSQWQQPMEQTAQKIADRQGFRYDLGTDPLYNQYRQQYMRQGKMAMADTVGQAAAMNGGYGSSYGQTAGQQVYNGHIQQLNDRIPELYGMALQKWQAEGADLMDRFGVMGQMEGKDYSRYRDDVGDWQSERNYANSRYDAERDYDRQLFDSDRNFGYNAEIDERNYNYQVGKDQQARDDYYRDWAQKMVEDYVSKGETPPEWLVATSQYDTTYLDWVRQQAAAKKAGGGGGWTGSTESDGDGIPMNPNSPWGAVALSRGTETKDTYASGIADAYRAAGATEEQVKQFWDLLNKKGSKSESKQK